MSIAPPGSCFICDGINWTHSARCPFAGLKPRGIAPERKVMTLQEKTYQIELALWQKKKDGQAIESVVRRIGKTGDLNVPWPAEDIPDWLDALLVDLDEESMNLVGLWLPGAIADHYDGDVEPKP